VGEGLIDLIEVFLQPDSGARLNPRPSAPRRTAAMNHKNVRGFARMELPELRVDTI
jgi:hypothetical protein